MLAVLLYFRRLLISLMGVVMFSSLVTARGQSPAVKDYDDAEAYEVYATIIPQDWLLTAAHTKKLLIRRETQATPVCLQPDQASEPVIGPAIRDYVEKAKTTWLLQPSLEFGTPYEFVSASELGTYFTSDADRSWKAVYRHYPSSNGYLTLSAVGFNADKSIAVVFEGHSCGSQCGGGTFHVLRKRDGRWIPAQWTGVSCAIAA